MSDNRPTHSTGRRSNRATRRHTPGHLAALITARRRPGIFRHSGTIFDILLRSGLSNLAKMGIGIQNRLGCGATGNQKEAGEQQQELVER